MHIESAIRDIKPRTVEHCFQKAGFIPLMGSELLPTAADQLKHPEPLILEDYSYIDVDVPSTEELPDG